MNAYLASDFRRSVGWVMLCTLVSVLDTVLEENQSSERASESERRASEQLSGQLFNFVYVRSTHGMGLTCLVHS